MDKQKQLELELKNITKYFGKVVAVNRLTLSVQKGEFITLLGPSGCGKTTTLRIVAGLLLPDEGEIFIKGKEVSRVPPQRRNLGMVFQDYALFPHLTVIENVKFPLRERRIPKKEQERLAMEFLNIVQLALPNRYPSELSGGQQQRVALARAIVFKPSILLMDEPLGALDVKLREAMQLEIKHLQKQLNVTTLYVTHDQHEALNMSDRILVMQEGMILQDGTPNEIYERPANQFVADFIGQSNFLDGIVTDRFLVQGPENIRIKVGSRISFSPGTPVTLSIRPEVISLSNKEIQNPDLNCFSATIKERKYLGKRTIYHVCVGGKIVLVEEARDRRSFPGGENVYIFWDPKDTLIWSR
jgi:spermidine/putrescine ABC transporter ATP-binding subunit